MSLPQQRLQLGAQVALEQHHQRADLGGGPLPVLDREGVERQHADAEPGGGLDGVAHRLDAGAMPFDARQVPLRGPAAVAVHDDGDVRGQPVEVDLARERLVRVARTESTPAARQATRRISTQHRQAWFAHGAGPRSIIVHPDEEQAVRRAPWRRRRRGVPPASSDATEPAARQPRPTSTSVPAMARTMCRRKPSPATSYVNRPDADGHHTPVDECVTVRDAIVARVGPRRSGTPRNRASRPAPRPPGASRPRRARSGTCQT